MLQDFLVVSVARPYSATVSGEPARALPGRPGLQTDVSSVVRALLGLKGLHQADLAPVLRISSSGVNEKLRGKRRWTLEDVDALLSETNTVTKYAELHHAVGGWGGRGACWEGECRHLPAPPRQP